MSLFSFDPLAQLSVFALRVKDRDGMIDFYCKMLGFKLKTQENELAILSAADANNERIWLEESPRAKEHFGEVKRLNHYHIEVPTLAELAAIYSRLVHANYPIIDADFTSENCIFTIIDPEENRLVLSTTEAIKMDEASLLTGANPELPLSSGARISGLGLHALDVNEECQFLTEILGFTFDEQKSATQQLADGTFSLAVVASDTENVKVPSHQILGLDFLKFILTDEQFESLLAHLINQQQEYYLDSKKRILTIYDPVGVEWWFLR